MTNRTGRRPGHPDTREQILAAARRRFAEAGYDRASIRAIADEAGVDSRLVSHYFGSKHQLFIAAAEPPVDPATAFPALMDGQGDPAKALAMFLATLLDDPEYLAVAIGLIRAAASEPQAAEMARQFLSERMLRPIAEHLGADRPELRATLLASQVSGLVLTRSILGLEPVASLDTAGLAAALEPVVRRYLQEPLD